MIDKISNLPNRSQTNEAFAESADKAWPQLNRFADQANALGDDVNAKQIAAATSAGSAATSAAAAALSESNAATAANAASQIAGATKWVSGANYLDGKAVWSPASKLTYRKNGDGVSNTDPGLDVTGWVSLTPTGGGSGGAVITGDVTLVASSPAAMVVAPTKHGCFATMPDATTLGKGVTQYGWFNSSNYGYGIKDKLGSVLGWVAPHSGASVLLADNVTVAGTWGGIGLEKAAITSETLVFGDVIRRVQIDASREFFLFMFGTQQYAIVYDATANQYGSLTMLGSDAPHYLAIDVLVVDANLLLLTWLEAGSNPVKVKAMTISIAGNTITPNTGGMRIYTGTYSASYLANSVKVGSTYATGWVEGSSERYVMGITISGTTPAFGTPRALSSGGSTVQVLTSLNGLLVAISNTSNKVECTPFSVTGNALTYGTIAYLSHATSYNTLRVVVNGQGNIFVQHDGGVAICKLTGTVASISNYSTGTPPTNMNYSCIHPIETNKLLVSIINGTEIYSYLVTDTNGSASGSYTGVQPGPYSLDTCVALVSYGTKVRVLAGNSYSRTVIGIECATSSPAFSNLEIRSYDINTQIGVSYYSQGQDKFGNISPVQLRSLTKDFFVGSSAYPSFLQIADKELMYGYGRFDYPDVAGKTSAIGWGTKQNLQGDMSVLRKIEVCE